MQFLKFLKKIIYFLPIFFVMIGVNYIVDPAKLFKNNNYYQNLAAILHSGQNIGNLVNYDERLVQKFYIEDLKDKKNIVVLGSSRAMLLNHEMFAESSFHNSSVSSASLEDDMAIYWMYRKNRLAPNVVIIGLDPWLLNKFNGNNAYQTIISDYNEISQYLGFSRYQSNSFDMFSSKYFELVSPKYFQSALKFWYAQRNLNNQLGDYYATTSDVGNDIIRHADGSISYDLKYRSRTSSKIREVAASFVDNNASMLNHFTRLDSDLKNKFDKFISLLIKDGVEVIFYLPPYHPAAYNKLVNSPRYKIITDAQKYFQNYAKNKNIQIIGSYNPVDLGLKDEGFYDAMHQNVESITKMFSKLML